MSFVKRRIGSYIWNTSPAIESIHSLLFKKKENKQPQANDSKLPYHDPFLPNSSTSETLLLSTTLLSLSFIMQILILLSLLRIAKHRSRSGIHTKQLARFQQIALVPSTKSIHRTLDPISGLTDGALRLSFIRLIPSLLLEILTPNETSNAFLGRTNRLFPLTFTTILIVNVSCSISGDGSRAKLCSSMRSIPFCLSRV